MHNRYQLLIVALFDLLKMMMATIWCKIMPIAILNYRSLINITGRSHDFYFTFFLGGGGVEPRRSAAPNNSNMLRSKGPKVHVGVGYAVLGRGWAAGLLLTSKRV